MSDRLVLALIVGAVAGVVTSLLVPPIVRLAVLLKAVDKPDARKVQAASMPRLGGVAMFLALALGGGIALVARWTEWSAAIPREEFLALGLGATLVFVVGVVDDLVGVSPGRKFLVEFFAAWLLVRVGWNFGSIRLPWAGEIELGVFGGVVSLLWVVGVTNAINLIDGLDGLATGVAAIISASLLVYSVLQQNWGTVTLMAGIVGVCLGFLRHNWEPARVFMGDSGSLTLGFLLGAMTLHSSIKAPAAVAIIVPILALGVPVIDTLLVMLVRFVGGGGRPVAKRFLRMFHADRQHLHHLLGNLVGRHRQIVAVLYGTVVVFCAGALLVAMRGDMELGFLLLGFEILVVIAMRWLGLTRAASRLAQEQKAEVRARLESWELDRASGEIRAAPTPLEPPSAPRR
ncbi:MAG: MraY family glycosyltransferase [Thermoanaerobaculia bacterium]